MASLTDLQKSFIPGRGYVPAVKAGKETLKRAKAQRESPSARRRGPTARDRQDAESVSMGIRAQSEGFGPVKSKLKSMVQPLDESMPKGQVADNEVFQGAAKGGPDDDLMRVRRALKRVGGKRGNKGVHLSWANGPVEREFGINAAALPAERIVTAGEGLRPASRLVTDVRGEMHRKARKGKKGGKRQAETTRMIRDQFGSAGAGYAWSPPKPLARMMQIGQPAQGKPSKQPGGRSKPFSGRDSGKTAQEIADHEAAHLHETGSSRLRRKLVSGHITSEDFARRQAARRVAHDHKAGGGAKYLTKEEARADARVRQVGDGSRRSRNFVSGHDFEEGYVDSFNRIKAGMNRTEKRRRKQGGGKHRVVDRIVTRDQAASGVRKSAAVVYRRLEKSWEGQVSDGALGGYRYLREGAEADRRSARNSDLLTAGLTATGVGIPTVVGLGGPVRRLATAGAFGGAVTNHHFGRKGRDYKRKRADRWDAKADRIQQVGEKRSRDNVLAKASLGVPASMQQPVAPAAASAAAPAAPTGGGVSQGKKKPTVAKPKAAGVSKSGLGVDPAFDKYFDGGDPRGNQALRELQRNDRVARSFAGRRGRLGGARRTNFAERGRIERRIQRDVSDIRLKDKFSPTELS